LPLNLLIYTEKQSRKSRLGPTEVKAATDRIVGVIQEGALLRDRQCLDVTPQARAFVTIAVSVGEQEQLFFVSCVQLFLDESGIESRADLASNQLIESVSPVRIAPEPAADVLPVGNSIAE
jgi:hypothetical protein